jgi:1-deoxy-D-xylulose-5-phosphate synthase
LHEEISTDIYNLRFLKPIDETWFLKIAAAYQIIVFAEDGIKSGGIGQRLERLVKKYHENASTLALGFPDRFLAHGKRHEVLAEAGLSPQDIVDAVKRCQAHIRHASQESKYALR